MDLIILTGMSGSGKNTAFKMMEDFGYFCVDNLPAKLIDKFLELALDSPETMDKVVLGVDVRGSENIDQVLAHVGEVMEKKAVFRLLFMETSNEVLLQRYKESRRKHPLSDNADSLTEAIELERERLAPLKKMADYVIDTSCLLTRELQTQLYEIFMENKDYQNMNIVVESFGFKYGIPTDADYVLDVRFLPNPYYDQDLRPLSGNDEAIQNYVFSNENSTEFLDRLFGLADFLVPEFVKAGKNQIVVAVGCTGGRHRSVSVANRLYAHLKKNKSSYVKLLHRDLGRKKR